jgi:hypothetical protein
MLMSVPNRETPCHSADVRIALSINGHVLSVGQLGPDFIILREPINYPPTDASILLSIDGDEQRWSVHLPDGIEVSKAATRIHRLLNGSAVG